ncbi:MAG: pyridoxal-phosphate dependent enzyme, partial [Thermoproteota archaeon]
VTHFFTGVGTGGTITGIGAFLKEKNPDVKIIGCQPQQNHLIQGWRNFEESAKPELFLKRESVVDDWVYVDNDEAFSVVKDVLLKDKLLISPSSAAVYACMKKYSIPGDGCVVGIFADDGRKFKSVYAKQNIMTENEFEDALKEAKYMSELAY